MPLGESPVLHLRVFTVSRYAMHSAKELFRVCSIQHVERRSFSALCCASKLASFMPVASCRADGAASPLGADTSPLPYACLPIFNPLKEPVPSYVYGCVLWPTSFPDHPFP